MKRSMMQVRPGWPLLAAGVFLTACAPATPDTASGSTASSTVRAQRAPAVACPAAQSDGAVTSKVRHAPNEDDPCADSRGPAPH
jgi:hypothetical protein